MPTKIQWCTETWNPTVGCSRTSPGCDHCYAIRVGARLQHLPAYAGTIAGGDWTGEVRLVPERLDLPLRWRKPRRIFVNSMSDLFHPDVPDEFIYDVLAVMAEAPQHTYQVLTKRPQRMAKLLSDEITQGRVAKAVDRILVRQEISQMGPVCQVELPDYPGYWVTDRGDVLLEGGSELCVWCGEPMLNSSLARARFCSQRCNSKAHYEMSQGRWQEPQTLRRLRPDVGEQGHQRVTMTGRDGQRHRELVHRLILAAFRRVPASDEQGCHRDGDPSNNALPNLRWGTQEDNWADRVRHGNGRPHSKLTVQEVGQIREGARAGRSTAVLAAEFGISDMQVRNIVRGDQWVERSGWPLPSLWAGTSIESDRYTFRARYLVETPAAVRFVSAEPLLGPLHSLELTGIDWLIVGGESGPGARRMDPGWAIELRDRCAEAGVAFFFKQAGAVLAAELGATHRAGANLDELPPEFHVRQMPAGTTVPTTEETP